MSDTAALGISLLLLAANAWFVVFEFSLVRMRSTRLEELEARGVPNAAAARRMHGRMNDYLGACQVGITSASLAIGWLAEPAFGALIEPAFGALSRKFAAAAAFTLITVLHIVIGEQVPKAAAIQVPERALLWSVTPMRVFFVVFFVPLRVLNAIVNLTLRLIGLSVRPHEEPSLSTEEIRIAVTEGYRQGEVSLDRSLLLENALDFDTMVVKEAMVPIARAATLDLEASTEEHAGVMKARGLSRYLVRAGQRFVGYVHVKELVFGSGAPLAELVRPLPTIAGTTPLNRLLRRMQRDRTHIALVMDEADAPIGVVTLEDLLEKLVGEIHDEFEAVQAWNLADHVDAGAVDLELRPSGRDEAIRALLGRITRVSPEIHGETTVQALLRREALAPTAVEQGVALPHARLPGLRRTHVAIARLPEPIVWTPAADAVRFIFLILTPADTPLEQNRALMRVAGLVHDDLLFARLDEAPTPDALIEVVRAADVVA